MMPSPKENELIEKVIEFDQSIETNFRERERNLCCEWVEGNLLRFCLFFMRRIPLRQTEASLLTLLPPFPIPISLIYNYMGESRVRAWHWPGIFDEQ